MLSDADRNALIQMLQDKSPLVRLTHMEAQTVFDLMQQRGWKIAKPAEMPA